MKKIFNKKNIKKLLTKKNLLYILTFSALFLVQFTTVCVNYLVKYGIIQSSSSVNSATVLYVCCPFLLIIYIYDIFKNKRKLDIFDYILFGLFITGIISTIFAIEPKMSFWGSIYRHEGFVSIFTYYLLCMNWKVNGTKEDIKKIIKIILIIGIINSLYGLLQVYTKSNHILRYYINRKMAVGFCGHPNFFGTLMITCLGIMTCYLLTEKITIKKIIIYLLFLISLINCQSTGPILTFVIMTIFLVIFYLVKKSLPLKKLILVIVLGLLIPGIYVVTIYVNKNSFNNSNCELCELQQTIMSGGTGRIEIWTNTLDVVKDNWLVGVGYDNLHKAYSQDPTKLRIVDNAHNVYLHTLVSTGILGFIPYMMLLILTFIKGIKSKNKSMFVLFSGFIAYSIQAFTNINVVQVAPVYYVIIGLMLSINEKAG